MARPIKYYVIYQYGLAVDIAHGLEAARRLHGGKNGYKTLKRAEEVAAWHNYEAYLPGGWLNRLPETPPPPPPCECCHCKATRQKTKGFALAA